MKSTSNRIAVLAGAGLILWSCGSKEKEVAAPAPQETASQQELDARGAEFSSIPKALIVQMDRDPESGTEKVETAKLIELDFVPTQKQLEDTASILARGKIVSASSVSSSNDDDFTSTETGRGILAWLFPGYRGGFKDGLLQAYTGRTGREHFFNHKNYAPVTFGALGHNQYAGYAIAAPSYIAPISNRTYNYEAVKISSTEKVQNTVYTPYGSNFYENGGHIQAAQNPYNYFEANQVTPCGGQQINQFAVYNAPQQNNCNNFQTQFSNPTAQWNVPYAENVY